MRGPGTPLLALLLLALPACGGGYDYGPNWIRDPEGNKWDEPRGPYIRSEDRGPEVRRNEGEPPAAAAHISVDA